MGSVSELYTFMDSADTTLMRRVLGEGGEEGAAEGEASTQPPPGEAFLSHVRSWRARMCRRQVVRWAHGLLDCLAEMCSMFAASCLSHLFTTTQPTTHISQRRMPRARLQPTLTLASPIVAHCMTS
jgi:hypothetical protein